MIGRRNKNQFKIVFREPVTLKRLEAACLALGVDIDRIISNPEKVLNELDAGPRRLQDFCDIVLRSGPNLMKMTVDRASAVGYMAVSDFFLHIYMAQSKGRMTASLPYIKKPGLLQRAVLALQ